MIIKGLVFGLLLAFGAVGFGIAVGFSLPMLVLSYVLGGMVGFLGALLLSVPKMAPHPASSAMADDIARIAPVNV